MGLQAPLWPASSTIEAANLPSNEGVVFNVRLPKWGQA